MALSKGKARLVERLQNPRFRPGEGQFVVEGVRGAREVLKGSLSLDIRFTLVSPRLATSQFGRLLIEEMRATGIPLEEISDQELELLSATEQPQGVLLVAREPHEPLAGMNRISAPKLLLLDGVQDPGNVGTLIRAAQAFGLSGVMALEGTADPFNPKAVRASAGALAHISVLRIPWDEAEAWLAERDVPVLVADAGGEDIGGFEAPSRWALGVGNEGAGPREALVSSAMHVLSIPMDRTVDSLNAGVAGAILLFALSPSSRNDTEN